MTWQVTFNVFRYKQDGSPPHFDLFPLVVRPDEYMLDAVERIWAEQDRTLVFRHACHHAGCGACGMRVNGREKLTCITRIDAVTTDGGSVTIEPLRNFAVVSDLAVDMTEFYTRMEQVRFAPVREAEPMQDLATGTPAEVQVTAYRLENCLECGICISACPIAGSDPDYLGPAALAAIERMVQEPRGVDVPALVRLADSEQGVWRCHTAFECSAACPADVDPAGLLLQLRRQIVGHRIKHLLGIRS